VKEGRGLRQAQVLSGKAEGFAELPDLPADAGGVLLLQEDVSVLFGVAGLEGPNVSAKPGARSSKVSSSIRKRRGGQEF
jgi:hypothetical protein